MRGIATQRAVVHQSDEHAHTDVGTETEQSLRLRCAEPEAGYFLEFTGDALH
jgi:hypothetical protein